MKMLVNRQPVSGPWGGGNNFVKALFEFGPKHGFEPVTKFDDNIDLIFVIDPRYDNLAISINEVASYKSVFKNTKVVYRINECDKRKGETNVIDPLINYTSHVSDLCIFISNWIKEYHVNESWGCKNNCVIYSGVNKDHFHSTQTNSDKVRIVTHHWSDNFMKGQDVYERIDSWIKGREDYEFTYIGRTKANLSNTRIVEPTFGKELGNKLSRHDVYISASRYDPGPNHIIESLACGIPTYAHVDAGGAVEMVGNEHTYRNFDDLLKILEGKKFNKNNAFNPCSWEECMDSYFYHIKKLYN